ncbi:MAG: hypothetical protein A2284_08300 [Deltaproteobacteria bacterium RIFOXYA12_FULL_61_11]|nr:MAG: hypothetical protein A2284_08300 [Deltaproteobacteria bacterium RIFOXYA12_FULL_61_11]
MTLRPWLAVTCLLLAIPAPSLARSLYQEPEIRSLHTRLRAPIEFWKRVYAVYDRNDILIHDARRLEVVYEVLSFPINARLERIALERVVERRLEYYRELLASLAGKKLAFDYLTGEQIRLVGLLAGAADPVRIEAARNNLRWQRGLREGVARAVERSAVYRKIMVPLLRAQHVPEELVNLVFVESMFDPTAVSPAGAVGLWQITRTGASGLLRVDHRVDERRHPLKSTKAAAGILARNYRQLGSWPLAITAYNTGVGGLRDAARSAGSRDLAEIIERATAPAFGFASRNFYAEFVAIDQVYRERAQYFGPLAQSGSKGFPAGLFAFEQALPSTSPLTD